MKSPADVGTLASAWRQAYGAPPEDYVVIDIETTGFDEEFDPIVQVGWLRVVSGREVERKALAVNWAATLDALSLNQLRDRIRKTSFFMQNQGKEYKWSVERLQREGVPPAEVVRQLSAVLATRPVLVGHNAWKFDVPRLDRFVAATVGCGLGVPPTALIDTQALVRALQSGVTPTRAETYKDFTMKAIRVGGSKYRSSLDDYCVTRFQLRVRRGADVREAHDAGYDCWLTHLVYEDLRHILINGQYPDGVAP